MTLPRRAFLQGTLASAVLLGAPACVPLDRSAAGRLAATLRIIEAQAGGMLGAEILDVASGLSTGINRDARFGHCSSFKLSLAAMVLKHREMTGDRTREVPLREEDIVSHAPFVAERVGTSASLFELAEAAQRLSDNAATNILLRELGGPAAMTAFWRETGDAVSRLDRFELDLNFVPEGEVRDTTTPRAMARTIAELVFGETLRERDRSILRHWMIDTATGLRRVRAGLPRDWQAGDKTGTSIFPGMDSLYVDIGFVERPGHGPLTFAAYYRAPETHTRIEPEAERVLARVGEVVTRFALQVGASPVG